MTLQATARALVEPGKGILAADESHPTMEKRLARVGLPSTERVRRDYREVLMSAPDLSDHISGVILFDETIRQSRSSGTPFAQGLLRAGIIPGIKVDAGTTPLPRFPTEVVTQGLRRPGRAADGVRRPRRALRQVARRHPHRRRPTHRRLCRGQRARPGPLRSGGAGVQPGAGQTPVEATARLDALNRNGPQPWELSFSFGRALQAPVLDAWAARPEDRQSAQAALMHRARMNGLARRGRWSRSMEPATVG